MSAYKTLVDSSQEQKRMGVEEIIQAELKREGREAEFQKFYMTLVQMLKMPNYRMMRSGNSLLLLNITAPHQGIIHLMTAENPRGILISATEFAKALKIAGYKSVKTTMKNKNLADLAGKAAESAGVKYAVQVNPQGGFDVEWRE